MRCTCLYSGNQYAALASNGIVTGYPRLIANDWQGMPDNIDTSLYINATYKYQMNSNGVMNAQQTTSGYLYVFKVFITQASVIYNAMFVNYLQQLGSYK